MVKSVRNSRSSKGLKFFKVNSITLSDLLNEATPNYSTLAGLSVTHLAWADDIVILALDTESIQKVPRAYQA